MSQRTLADPRVVPLPFVAEGRGTPALFMSYNALRRFRERTGLSPFAAISEMAKVLPEEKLVRVDSYLVQHFVWAGLHFAARPDAPLAIDPTVTIDDVGDWLYERLTGGGEQSSFFLQELEVADLIYESFYAAGLLKRPTPEPVVDELPPDPPTPATDPH